jgi:CheY-like chemotaxis protein
MAALILALLEEHSNAEQVKTCLEECGHEVSVVNNFVKAKALLSSRGADLIISDVHLENGGDVFDFLRWVKKNQKTSSIPFVLFSSQPTPTAKFFADGLRTTARILGAAKYIEMEIFDAAEFRDHIHSVLPKEKIKPSTKV